MAPSRIMTILTSSLSRTEGDLSETTARRLAVLFWVLLAGAVIVFAYAVENVIRDSPFFFSQNVALFLLWASAALLLWSGRGILAVDIGVVGPMIVLIGYQTAALWILDRPLNELAYVPLLLVLITQTSAAFAVRLRHHLIPLVACILASAAAVIRFWVLLVGAPVASTGIVIIYILGLGMSVATYLAFRRADREVRLRARLVSEVHHRIRNETIMLLALLDNEIETAESDQTQQALRRDRQRIVTVLSTHRHILDSSTQQLVSLDAYLADVIRPVTVDLVVPDQSPIVHHRPSGIGMPPGDALTVGLIMNELLVRAVEHSDRGSSISVAVSTPARQRILLTIENPLPGTVRINQDGEGTDLGFVEQLVKSMGGTVSVDTTRGYLVTAEVPATRIEMVDDWTPGL